MKEIMAALYAFWSQFGIPAYAEDMVPSTADLPYIRYTVTKAAAMEASVMTALRSSDTGWTRKPRPWIWL